MGCQNCILRVQRHFLRNFFHRIILFGTVSEKIQLVLWEQHSVFPGNFWANKFSFSRPWQIFHAWVAKTVFYVSRGSFCGTFFTESQNRHCERKNSVGFAKTAFYFSGELLSKTFLEVVDMAFFLVLAKFFKHELPKLYSTCPEALFAEFFSQNHIKCHYEPKNSAGFVKTAF